MSTIQNKNNGHYVVLFRGLRGCCVYVCEDSKAHRGESTAHRGESTAHREESTAHRGESTAHREEAKACFWQYVYI